MKTEEELVEEFAKAWETLDAELIVVNLDDNFVYNSQWVMDSLDRKGYIEYIRGKFNAIKSSSSGPNVKIVPDRHMGGKMIALQQGKNEPIFYRIKVKDGKVIKGDLCMF
jgi:hypothetical protein